MNNKTLFRKYGTLTRGVNMTYLEEEGIIFEDENNGEVNFHFRPVGYKYIDGVRSIGYTFAAAIGELIDNAKDAKATRVDVTLEADEKDQLVKVTVKDNGSGMTAQQLANSFTLGAHRQYKDGDTGKYGKGGTEGSLSFAAKKTVYTKKDGIINGEMYDLQVVEKEDRWGSVKIPVPHEIVNQFGNSDGTIIIHEDIDRAKGTCKTVSRRVMSFASRAYYDSLLSGFSVYINDEPVIPFDPLCWDNPDVVKLADEPLHHNGIDFRVRAVYLAAVDTSISCFGNANRGVGSLSRLAGGYAIREGRVLTDIPMSSQTGLRGFYAPHTDYRHLRWAIYYPSALDKEMGTTTRKDAISMDQDISDKVSEVVMKAKKTVTNFVRQSKHEKNRTGLKKCVLKTQNAINQVANVKGNYKVSLVEWSVASSLAAVKPGVVGDEYEYEVQLNTLHPSVSAVFNESKAVQEMFVDLVSAVIVGIETTYHPEDGDLRSFKDSLIEKISNISRNITRKK